MDKSITQTYLEFTRTTAIYPKETAGEYLALGLTSEAGEVAGVVKKIIRDDGGVVTPEAQQKLVSETADCLWYVTRIADELGLTLDDLIEYNIQKLSKRLEKGTLKGSGDNR